MDATTKTRDELIQSCTNMVWKLALKYRIPGMEVEDIVQCGYLGLIAAADKFDPARGVKFGTFAHRCIYNDMMNAIRAHIKLDPLNVFQHDGSGALSRSHDSRAVCPCSKADISEQRRVVRKVMKNLDTRDRNILKRRFMDDSTLKIVGEEMGVSRERVRQLETRAKERFKRRFLNAC